MTQVRAGLVLAVLVAAPSVGALSARAAVHPQVTRAQASKRLGRMLGAKPTRVQLVFADERLTDVDLEWIGYAPRAHLRPIGVPVGYKGRLRTYVGPAVAWISAVDRSPMGVESVSRRHRAHRYAVPGRSYSISAALVQKLWEKNLRIRLVQLHIHPTISRKRALGLLRSRRLQSRRIWLVTERRRLAWLAAVQRGRYALLDARRGKIVEVTAR
jgi:hypothetical protein